MIDAGRVKWKVNFEPREHLETRRNSLGVAHSLEHLHAFVPTTKEVYLVIYQTPTHASSNSQLPGIVEVLAGGDFSLYISYTHISVT